LKAATVDRYRIIFRQLERFAEAKGIRYVKELDFVKLSQFRATWKDGALSGHKKLERVRAIFGFAKKMRAVTENPALELEMPIVRQMPTLPFTHEEMGRILLTVEKEIAVAKSVARRAKWRRVRTLILFLRYSGLRISDAVGCGVERVQDGKLFLYTAKTGQEVYVPLPEMVVRALEDCERVSERYWFWTSQGKVETARKKWSESLTKVFRDAKVKDGHAHRFRDTFAVELLKKGTPIENVGAFLGHASVRVTQKHYSAWVKARQERAEADVRASWESDPVLAMEKPAGGAYQVRENREAVN
jgi:integrase/recombinase XerD